MQTRRAVLGAAAAASIGNDARADDAEVIGAFGALHVADAKALADWHRRMFGYAVVSEGAPAQGPVAAFALLRRDGAILEIIQPREPAGPGPSPERPAYERWGLGAAKIGFIVRDIEALERRLRAQGATFNHGLVRSPQLGKRTFAVRDPEGNTVQVFET